MSRNTENRSFVVKAGDRIKFKGEKQRYTVQAASPRFAVCTKPFNLKGTVLYTIVDFEEFVRGVDDYVLGKFNYERNTDCSEALDELLNGEMRVSRRNRVPLEIEAIIYA